MSEIMRGEIVGAEFYPDDMPGKIIIRVAVDDTEPVGKYRVVMVEESYFDSQLPTADDVRGILR